MSRRRAAFSYVVSGQMPCSRAIPNSPLAWAAGALRLPLDRF
jgi:hypothetical protein